jgi:hypothetical protein
MAVFRYTPAAPHVFVGDVDTLPKEFEEKRVNQVLRDVFASLQRSRRGGLGDATVSLACLQRRQCLCAPPPGLLA